MVNQAIVNFVIMISPIIIMGIAIVVDSLVKRPYN
jgi:hypothetical protein